jgi:hypothetical protein
VDEALPAEVARDLGVPATVPRVQP